jgi:hypothetical protein
MLAIEGRDSPSCVQNAMEKFGEDNQKAGKTS